MPPFLQRPAYKVVDVDSAVCWSTDLAPKSTLAVDGSDVRERERKRRRIEQNAQKYLQGDQLYIRSASLKGPIAGWKNPWTKASRTKSAKPKAPARIKPKASIGTQSKLNLQITKFSKTVNGKATSSHSHGQTYESRPSLPLDVNDSGLGSEVTSNDDHDRQPYTPSRTSQDTVTWLHRQASSPATSASRACQDDGPSNHLASNRAMNTESAYRAESMDIDPPWSTAQSGPPPSENPRYSASREHCENEPSRCTSKPAENHAGEGLQNSHWLRQQSKDVAAKTSNESGETGLLDAITTPNGFRYRKRAPRVTKLSSPVVDIEPMFVSSIATVKRPNSSGLGGSLAPLNQVEHACMPYTDATGIVEDIVEDIETAVLPQDDGVRPQTEMLPPPVPPAIEIEDTRCSPRHSLINESTQAAFTRAQESFNHAFSSPSSANIDKSPSPIRKVSDNIRRDSNQHIVESVREAEESCTLRPESRSPPASPTAETPNLRTLALDIDFSTGKKEVLGRPTSKPKPRVSFSDYLLEKDQGEAPKHDTPSQGLRKSLLKGAKRVPLRSPSPPHLISPQSEIGSGQGEESLDVDAALDSIDDFLDTANFEHDLRELEAQRTLGGRRDGLPASQELLLRL